MVVIRGINNTKTNFGRGFYTTSQVEQAANWIIIKYDYDFTTVKLYESGVLDAQAAIAQLKAYKTYYQLSFHAQRVMDELRFEESDVIK